MLGRAVDYVNPRSSVSSNLGISSGDAAGLIHSNDNAVLRRADAAQHGIVLAVIPHQPNGADP